MAIVIEYRAEVGAAIKSLRKLRVEMAHLESADFGGDSLQALRQSAQQASRQISQISTQNISNVGRVATASSRSMKSLAASARAAATATSTVRSGSAAATLAAGGLGSAVTGVASQAGRARNELGRFVKGAGSGIDNVAKSTRGATRAMTGFRAAIGGAFALLGIRGLAQANDSLVLIQNRLRTVTDGFQELSSTQRELEAIGRRTRTQLGPLAELYQKIAQNSDSATTSQKDLFDEVEGLSAALASSGVSTNAAAAAITQYTQGVGLGKFETEELKTLLEQSAPVANALGREFNATRGELLGMAADGELTADRVRKAVRSLSGLSANIAGLPIETSRAFGLLRQEIGLLVGEFTQATGAGQGIAGILDSIRQRVTALRNRLPEVIQAVTILGTAVGTTLTIALSRAAVGFATTAVTATATFLSSIVTGTATLAKFLVGLVGVTKTMARLRAVLATLASPVLLVVAAVAAVVAAFVVLANDIKAISQTIVDNFDNVKVLLVSIFQQGTTQVKLLFARMALFAVESVSRLVTTIANFDFTGTLIRGFQNAAESIKSVFFGVGESIVNFIQGAFNKVIDITNDLISTITGGGFGEQIAEQFGATITQIGRIDIAGTFRRQFDDIGGVLRDLAEIDIGDGLRNSILSLEDQLSGLQGAGSDAARQLGEAFQNELARTPELIDVITDRLKQFVADNPALQTFLDALTGNIKLDAIPGGIAGADGAGGSSGANGSSGSAEQNEFDSRLNQTSSALGELNGLIQSQLLGTVSEFFQTLQSLTRIQETVFGAEGLLADRGAPVQDAAQKELATAVTQSTTAQTQGNIIQRGLSAVTNALGITQTTTSTTATAATTAATGATASLVGVVSLNTAAVTANTAALAASGTSSTITAISTAAKSGGQIPQFRRGTISVPGSGRGDKVLALTEPGELITPNRTRDQEALFGALEEKFGRTQQPQINVLDVDRRTERKLRSMIADGTVSAGINQREVDAGGTAVLR